MLLNIARCFHNHSLEVDIGEIAHTKSIAIVVIMVIFPFLVVVGRPGWGRKQIQIGKLILVFHCHSHFCSFSLVKPMCLSRKIVFLLSSFHEYEALVRAGYLGFEPCRLDDEWESIVLNYTLVTMSAPKGVVTTHPGQCAEWPVFMHNVIYQQHLELFRASHVGRASFQRLRSLEFFLLAILFDVGNVLPESDRDLA
eukprot:Gb_12689 [translate_table: standard]